MKLFPIIAHFKNIIFVCWWTGGKVGSKLERTVIFPGKSGAIVSILPWKDRSPPVTHS